MKLRKASALFMAAAMSASMFVVPAAADETEDPAKAIPEDVIPDETVTLNVFDQLANYSGEQIGWFGQVMLEKFNVKLNIIPDSDGTYETRMESGDLGDLVIWGNDGDEYLQAVDKGMLFDWNEDDILADYGPYIVEHMQPALEKNTQISGGTTYGIGFDIAQVTSGGVNLSEINPETCESKIVENLYFAGEIMDVDGPCGGYNLHFAWSSGIAAGKRVH